MKCRRYSFLFHTQQEKVKVKSVHFIVLVFLLPLSVAGFADTHASFSHFVAVGAPHVDGIVDGKRPSAHGFVSKVVTTTNPAWHFALFSTRGGFLLILAGVFFVLARLCLESHDWGLPPPFMKVTSFTASFGTDGFYPRARR